MAETIRIPRGMLLVDHPAWNDGLNKEYDYERNEKDGVALETLTAGFKGKVAWVCERGHRWEQSPLSRVHGHGCKKCSQGRKRELLLDHPAWRERLAERYDYKENEKRGIVLETLSAGSTLKVAWVCPNCGEPWDDTVYSMIDGRQCSVCETKRKTRKGYNDLATTDPDIASMWHSTLNGDLSPTMVRRGSHKMIWWLCPEGHPFDLTVNTLVTRKGRCPVCNGRRLLIGANDLKAMSPNIALDWDEKKNGVPASQVLNGGNKLDWWKCHVCGYEWQESRTVRTFTQKGCPCCTNYVVIPGINDLATTDSDIAAEWDYSRNGEVTPQQVTRGKDFAAWWICPHCGESYDLEIYKRTGPQHQGCPYCAGKRVGKSNNLATCFPRIAAEWHPTKNGNKRPEDFTYGSHKAVWWLCPVCEHSYKMAIKNRTHPTKPQGCPKCIESSYEQAVRRILYEIAEDYDLRIVPQWWHETCRIKHPLRFDFAVFSASHPQWRPSFPNLLIEVQGQQHYQVIGFFGGKRGYEKRVKSDKTKARWCVMNGVSLLQVPYAWDRDTIRVRLIGALVDAGVIPSLPVAA